MTRKQRRLVLIGSAGRARHRGGAGAERAARLDRVFSTPSMVAEKNIQPGQRFRLGGIVETGSLVRGEQLRVRFTVTDGNAKLPVTYTGILPDLFREGQGVISEGAIDPSGIFKADSVLAKHDENYMPKDVADALKKQGHWKPEEAAASAGAKTSGSATSGSATQ
ncbi:MAG: cytochrome c maturation protein CcmE [Xanthobacteraceae bacterium]